MSDPTDGAVVTVPLGVRVTLARPAIQLIAEEARADILHIKGDAVDPRLRPVTAPGTDVDAIVRPSHVSRLDAALRAHGWTVYSSFAFGSPFGHAQTYLHEIWGYFDLHRLFPGIRLEPSAAFDLMWADRHPIPLAAGVGSVPSIEDQAALLVLNAARSAAPAADPLRTWVDAPGLDRSAVEARIDLLRARVAFAAATGDLDSYRGAPDYALWRAITRGGSRGAEWWGRIRAADSVSSAVMIAARAPLVNVERLQHELGRRPTRREIIRAFFARPARALRELASRSTSRS